MAATLNDYLTDLQNLYLTNDSIFTANQLTAAVNAARREIIEKINLFNIDTISLTNGTATYDLNTILTKPFINVTEVWNWEGNLHYKLVRMRPNSYMLQLKTYPYWYWLQNNEITFYPTPIGSTAEIKYKYMPADLVNSGDTDNDIPSRFKDAVVALAAFYVEQFDGKIQLAMQFRQLSELKIGRINATK